MNMLPEDDIDRFLVAQANSFNGYAQALKEIQNGRKISHWIWFIFPQLRGLGHSRNSHYYGINGRSEAEEYLKHPILGVRLKEITMALLNHTDKTALSIFGGIDAIKVQSCMTLFDSISPNDEFKKVLENFYDGNRDKNSIL